MKVAMMRFVNKALAAAYFPWKENVREKTSNREKLERAMARFTARALASAFATWCTNAAVGST